MSWVAAAGTVGMDFVGGAMKAKRAKAARAWSKRRYAERYQVTVKDMRAAGINPILAASSGLGGGGTPTAGQGAPFPELGKTISTARDAGSKKMLKIEERRLLQSQNHNVNAQTVANRSLGLKHIADRRLADAVLPGALLQAEINESKWGRATAYADRALPAINTGLGALGVLRLGRSVMPTRRGIPSVKERGKTLKR